MGNLKVHFFYIFVFSAYFLVKEMNHSQVDQTRAPASVELDIIGNHETIQFASQKDVFFKAKIDSGAQTSSMHAFDISTYHRDVSGEEKLFVRFKTINDSGEEIALERPVSHIGEVKSASGKSMRYFIKDYLKIGNNVFHVHINLADRSGLSTKFLVGKEVLDKGYLIDTSKKMVQTAD